LYFATGVELFNLLNLLRGPAQAPFAAQSFVRGFHSTGFVDGAQRDVDHAPTLPTAIRGLSWRLRCRHIRTADRRHERLPIMPAALT